MAGKAAPHEPPKAVPTARVLADEYLHLFPGAAAPASEADYRTAALAANQAALCLSGGGIRSAAFALGVLQSLSAKGLLTGFHYLSTVSGGGYIGSWLQRWIADSDAGQVMAALGATDEPPQVKSLRENSNYLTPRIGIGSNDTWTALALSIRNILINGMLFAPLFLLIGLIPNLVAAAIGATPGALIADGLLVLGALCLGLATMWTCRALPSYRADGYVPARSGDAWVNLRIVLPLMLWGVLATVAVSPLLLDGNWDAPTLEQLALANAIGMGVGIALAAVALPVERRSALLHDLPVWGLAIFVASMVILIGARWSVRGTRAAGITHYATEVLTTMGPLLAMGAQLAATIIFVTFRSTGEARLFSPDGDREWLARLSALKLKPCLLWAVVALAAFGINNLLDYLLAHLPHGLDFSLAGLVTALSGATAVLGGRSAKSAGPGLATGAAIVKRLPVQALVSIATVVFVLALFTLHSRVEQSVAVVIAKKMALSPRFPIGLLNPWLVAHVLIAAVLLAMLLFLTKRIPVNRFSLSGLYRNRLSRAFLGGARHIRRPDPFTGFDPQDNVRMHSLLRAPGEQRLYPVVNVALNVTRSDKLAWQERKAEPFVFTPKYSGSGLLTREDASDGQSGAFISSDRYGGNEPDLALPGTGVTLATAMAISGAAASPNRGYNSSPATAFLMSLFNVRLGAWLPNPARAVTLGEKVTASGPSDNLRAMLRDLVGSTQDTGRDIYLSDGGHFDNLGIYEMIRRRCRYILVSDAGCDPACAFEDLGNAVRKVAIDQNVRIEFEAMHISGRGRDVTPQFAYATGTIHYPESVEPGFILYLKPSFFGSMPIDVRAYAAGSPTFPHETTGDQFFSESQFESYRALGRYFTGEIGGDAPADIAAFFNAVEPEMPVSTVFHEVEPPLGGHSDGVEDGADPGPAGSPGGP